MKKIINRMALLAGSGSGRMARRVFLRSLIAGAGIFASMWLVTESAQGGKPAPPPPVKFQLTVIHSPIDTLFDMNSSGEMVGYFRDVNNIQHACVVDAGEVIDLETLVTPPDGWYMASADGINDQGTIVGALGEVGVSLNDARRGFIMYRPIGGPPVLDLIPDAGWPVSKATQINEDGTVMGYFLNDVFPNGLPWGIYVFDSEGPVGTVPVVLPITTNFILRLSNSTATRPAQIAGNLAMPDGRAFRYTLGDAQPEIFPFATAGVSGGINDLNDSGWLCGWALNTAKPRPPRIAWRFDNTAYQTFSTSNGADRINGAGDMAISSSGSYSAQLYSQGVKLLNINDLLVGDPGDVALFTSAGIQFIGITERGVNPNAPGFPALGGRLNVVGTGSYAFILTPVAP